MVRVPYIAALQAEANGQHGPEPEDDPSSAPNDLEADDYNYFEDDPYTDPLEPEEEEDDDNHGQDGDDENHDEDAASREDSGVVHGPRISGFVVLPRKHRTYSDYESTHFFAADSSAERGYPRTIQDLGLRINVHNLPTLVSRFLFQQMYPDVPLPEDDIFPPLPEPTRVKVYHSAIATFYAPSDPSGIRGMHREYIRATPSWRKGSPRYDCVFVGKDASLDGFRGLHAARVRAFFSVLVPCLDGSEGDEWVPCALVEWFSAIGDAPDEVTGLWKVEPDYFEDGERMRDVVHVESLLRSAHLVPCFGKDPVPLRLKQHESLDYFDVFFVNKYADHHAFEIAF